MQNINHDYAYIPRPLRFVSTGEQLERVMSFRREEYRKRYANIEMAGYDPFDRHSHIIFAEDKQGRINSTARLVLDSEIGLPEDKLFPPLVKQYREEGKQLMEIGRFIIRDGDCSLLKKYYQAFYEIAKSSQVDYVVMIMRRKDLAFHKKLFGIDILIDAIGENFGSELTFMCAGWDVDNTRPAFFKWIK
ncbi:MAG: N-acyl amino acid synthase FeeM domain-containing protein [Thiolinea sp.]